MRTFLSLDSPHPLAHSGSHLAKFIVKIRFPRTYSTFGSLPQNFVDFLLSLTLSFSYSDTHGYPASNMPRCLALSLNPFQTCSVLGLVLAGEPVGQPLPRGAQYLLGRPSSIR